MGKLIVETLIFIITMHEIIRKQKKNEIKSPFQPLYFTYIGWHLQICDILHIFGCIIENV
jgi:hypothetical protein